MSTPKRHHFVPQFYLRKFSADGRSIALLNKKRRAIVRHASIKGQCAVDNFHSWADDAESALGFVEGACAEVLKEITNVDALPLQDSEQWNLLLLFVALQAGRTQVAADINDLMTDRWAKSMLEGRPEFDSFDAHKYSVVNTYPAALPIQVALESFQYLNDLSRCLLLNDSPLPFTTSDNPVIQYNSAKAHVHWEGVTGLDSSGLQILFPLGPRHCLYLYDSKTYSNPSNNARRKIGLRDAARVALVTYLNAGRNIYALQSDTLDVMKTVSEALSSYEDWERVVFLRTEAVLESDGKTKSELVIHYRTHVPIEVSFDFGRSRDVSESASDYRRRQVRRILTRSPQDGRSSIRYPVRKDSIRQTPPHLRGAELGRVCMQIEKLAQGSRRPPSFRFGERAAHQS